MIEASNLSVMIGDETIVARASFYVAAGKMGAMIGRNGSGKSSLLRTMLGMHRFTGELRVCGKEIRGEPDAVVRETGVALLPQTDTVVPSLTVLSNLLLAGSRLPASLQSILKECVNKQISAPAPISFLGPILGPLHALRARRGETLSGGEKGLVGVACALLAGPCGALLDEPLAGLSVDRRNLVIQSLLAYVSNDRFILAAEQDARFPADHCSIVLELVPPTDVDEEATSIVKVTQRCEASDRSERPTASSLRG